MAAPAARSSTSLRSAIARSFRSFASTASPRSARTVARRARAIPCDRLSPSESATARRRYSSAAAASRCLRDRRPVRDAHERLVESRGRPPPPPSQLACLAQVIDEDLGVVTRTPACHLLDPLGGGDMLVGARRARDLLVGDVADERVPERELVLALDRRDADRDARTRGGRARSARAGRHRSPARRWTRRRPSRTCGRRRTRPAAAPSAPARVCRGGPP